MIQAIIIVAKISFKEQINIMALNRVARLTPENTVFFECDVHGIIIPLIYRGETVVQNTVRLAKTAAILDVPLISTTQFRGGPLAEGIVKAHGAQARRFESK